MTGTPFVLYHISKFKEKLKVSETNIKIAIIEDQKDVADSLKDLFNTEDDMSCSQVYYNSEDAVTFLPKAPPHIVIADIGLPGMSGVEAIIHLREIMPETQFCMFTVFEDDEKIFKSLKAGAKGYILKNDPSEKVIAGARELYHGGAPMSPEIARKVIDSFSIKKKSSLPLTTREFELLELLSQGLLYKEIGVSLGITTGTVKQHIHKIYDKLQVNNRTEAINLYLNR
ncbi:MAG: response regulator transcription factor [Bacteroidota bacterium]